MPDYSPTYDQPRATARIATALVLGGTLLRILAYFFSDNCGGDAWARIETTAVWLQRPDFRVAFGAYAPGHFWLIGLFSLFLPNVTMAGRLLSLVLGIGSIYLVWKLARTLYGDTAAVLSVAVFSLYSLHVGYSTTSSAEVPFLFFLLVALYSFFGYFRAKRVRWLAASGLFLSAAESIRLEAWVFFFAMALGLLFLMFHKDSGHPLLDWSRFQPLLVFGGTGGIWPVLAMAGSWRTYGDPLRSLTVHNELVTGWFGSHPVPLAHQIGVIPGALLLSLSPIALIAAIYGLAKSFSSRLTGTFAGLILFFWAIQNYEILSGKLLAMARYSLTLGTLLAVVSGFGLEQIFTRLMPKRFGFAQTVVIVLLCLNFALILFASEAPTRYADKFASISPRLRYPRRVGEVGKYLRSHMGPEDKLVIDDYNVESNVVAAAAGLPVLSRNRAYLASEKNDIGVRDYIRGERPRFLVYSDEGTLRQSLALPSAYTEPATVDGVSFRCVFAAKIYRIYELRYP